jgi:lia operon protein LiaG
MNWSPRAAGTIVLLALMPAAVQAQERYGIGAEHVAIFNLAGAVTVHGTSGGQVTVEVTRGGRDADQLRVESGQVGSRRALRIIYPSDRVVYDAAGWRGSTNVRVRSDGTWGGDGSLTGRGRAVRVSNSGRGTQAHANLRIGVPAGQRVDVYLAVGRITAENVNGQVRLDTQSGAVTASGMSGSLTIDTGSGGVEVAGMQGDLHVDTGSGAVRISGVSGERVHVDTGSGRVVADGVAADRIVIDTGSGSIELRRGQARDVRLDTGSGGVNAELAGSLERVLIDTGSGGVTLALPQDVDARLVVDTGSGGITVDLPMQVVRRARSELEAVLGGGRGSIRVDTGSGSVRVRALQ